MRLPVLVVLFMLSFSIVSAAGTAPVAVSDSYTTSLNQTITVSAANGVLANDYDRENDTLSVKSFSPPSAETGKVTSFLVNGGFIFDPANNFQGTVSFSYRISDGTSTSKPAEITIVIGPRANRPPTAMPDSYWTGVNQAITEATPGVLRNDYDIDGDTISISSYSAPAHGTINNLLTNGAFTYTPHSGYAGVDTFTYTITDGAAKSEAITVTVYIGQTPGTEMLVNGGFERRNPNNARLPQNWQGIRLSGDSRVCTSKAHSGKCAFRFAGGTGESSGLVQIVPATRVDQMAGGDLLTLSALVRDNPYILSGSARLTFTVLYANKALPKSVVSTTIQAGTHYKYVQTATLILRGKPRKVQVSILFTGASGGFLIDAVSLAHNGTAVPRFQGQTFSRGNVTTQADPVMPEGEWLPLPPVNP